MTARNVLLVGGDGFLGRALASALAAGGATPIVAARSGDAAPGSHRRYCLADLSASARDELLASCESVVHVAATTTPIGSATRPTLEIEGNLAPLARLIEWLRPHPLTTMMFVSSGGALYGNPERLPVDEGCPPVAFSNYAAGKIAAEAFLQAEARESGRRLVILRPANVYGPGQTPIAGFGLIRTMLDRVGADAAFDVWGDGETIRDFLFIDDFVAACVALLERDDVGGTFNVGSGQGTSINALLAMVEKVTGRTPRIIRRPARPGDVRAIVLDCARLRDATGWRPRTDVERGLRATWAWLRTLP